MIDYRVRVDFESAIGVLASRRDQIDYAASRAVDAVTKQAQRVMRQGVRDRFTIRRPQYADFAIKISKFPTKGDPTAIIGIDPKRDAFAKFEAGGTKVPFRTGVNGKLSVPINRAGFSGDGVIPADLKARTLLTTGRGFIVRGRNGYSLVIERTGPAPSRLRGLDPNLKVRYTLRPSVPINARLQLVQTVEREVRAAWPKAATAEMRKALATARTPVDAAVGVGE